MSLIKAENLGHKFNIKDKDGNVTGENWAIKDMDFTARKGEIISILGKNGSGKSTFARHLNGLLSPDEGAVYIENSEKTDCYFCTDNENDLVDIRREIGMIFQNPDNQMVGNTVTEDIGFGLENLGWEAKDIWERINEILKIFNIEEIADRNTSHLSGGQKQRLAVASVMAMKPGCIVMDEATSMLDPENSKRVFDALYRINKEFNISIIMITHRIEETVNSDYVYVMSDGNVALSGKPCEIYKRVNELEALGVESLLQYKIGSTLGLDFRGYGDKIVSLEDAAGEIKSRYNDDKKTLANDNKNTPTNDDKNALTKENSDKEIIDGEEQNYSSKVDDVISHITYRKNNQNAVENEDIIISAEKLSYSYKDGNDEVEAVRDMSFEVRKGERIAVVGKTGSGKSTLLYMLNGLYRPQKGELRVFDFDVKNTKNLKALRKKIGFVFQYPEHQLFGNTVLDDVMYGPRNFGMKKQEALEAAKKALALVDMPECYYEYSPFDLSGGQKRRVALAGILAYEPEILILDEPVAGLDPQAKNELFDLINVLNREKNVTLIFVSHDMKDVYKMADRLIILEQGSLVYDGATDSVLENCEMAEKFGLNMPDAARFKKLLEP